MYTIWASLKFRNEFMFDYRYIALYILFYMFTTTENDYLYVKGTNVTASLTIRANLVI